MKADLCQDLNGRFAFSRCLNGTFPWRKCTINSEEKICICYFSHLGYCSNVLTEKFLQGNVPLRHMLNEETLFMSWERYAIKEVILINLWDKIALFFRFFKALWCKTVSLIFWCEKGALTLFFLPFLRQLWPNEAVRKQDM